MEYKTCEQYVLAEYLALQEKYDKLLERCKELEDELNYIADYYSRKASEPGDEELSIDELVVVDGTVK